MRKTSKSASQVCNYTERCHNHGRAHGQVLHAARVRLQSGEFQEAALGVSQFQCVCLYMSAVYEKLQSCSPYSPPSPLSASHMLRVFVCAPLVCFRLLLLGKHAPFS